ncbi:hypothetical protein DSO57_1005125 [Entomophthora muscae]|uniref:Uncharacterized protein n=1 Tax=Entomophthora muscae TaxID=34485 RepID=A0ACC2SA92_9FUNG|nr:hypothetical protein DSO57_1005125 [Entomophthora muscae]
MVLTRVSISSLADLGTTPESQFLDSFWRHVILGVWYTTTPLSNNPPVQEETKVYGSSTQVNKPQVFRPLALAFLLSYLSVYFFLGRFNPLLGRYWLLEELFHLGMVSLPVGSLVMGLNPPAIIHHLGSLIPSREYLQYQCQLWETEQLLAASNQPLSTFTPSPRVLDQEIIPAPALRPSFPGAPLLQQLAQPNLTMSAATGELPHIPSA